jgi:hypothetical protein
MQSHFSNFKEQDFKLTLGSFVAAGLAAVSVGVFFYYAGQSIAPFALLVDGKVLAPSGVPFVGGLYDIANYCVANGVAVFNYSITQLCESLWLIIQFDENITNTAIAETKVALADAKDMDGDGYDDITNQRIQKARRWRLDLPWQIHAYGTFISLAAYVFDCYVQLKAAPIVPDVWQFFDEASIGDYSSINFDAVGTVAFNLINFELMLCLILLAVKWARQKPA